MGFRVTSASLPRRLRWHGLLKLILENVEKTFMDMDPSPPVSRLKRAFFCAMMVLVLGAIGGFAGLTATNPKIPHPWGEIRLMQYSTNAGTTMAHFRFRNLFEWPVLIEVGLEVHTDHGWELARGYSMFVPIEKPVVSRDGQNFVVPVPFEYKEWHVLVRAVKADLTPTEIRREQIKQWLQSHYAGFLAKEIETHDPNGHIMPGPEMKFDKPGRLPTPYYGSAVRLPAWDPFPARASRTAYPRR